MNQRRPIVLAFAALVLAACAMGVSPILVRWAEVGPYASAFWRTALALPLLWAWARVESRDAAPPLLVCDRAVLLAGLLFAGDLFFWHQSILATTVANATFLATTAPVWVALGAWLLLGEFVGATTVVGLVLCLSGGAALLGQSYGFALERLAGDLFGIVTALFFGAYMLAVRAARGRHPPGRLAFVSTAISAACLLPVAALLEPTLLPQSMSGIVALVALATVSHVGGQGLFTFAVGTLPATFSSLVIFIEAIAAAGLGWLLLGEPVAALQAAGGVLILAGIFLARPRAREMAMAGAAA
jgi:drug/metabolite transporter (DMT)-like permease